ncbi:hypothetical protein T484DRAFT_1981783 [Baffinella frigidus]|nr:hypothetical protein T484DRAFT_1981783 [Cryptophyta sp. CCMP2293]
MRHIDASSASPAPALIDDLETSLQRKRAVLHREQESPANKADACAPPADTLTERREREARWRDEALSPLAPAQSPGPQTPNRPAPPRGKSTIRVLGFGSMPRQSPPLPTGSPGRARG